MALVEVVAFQHSTRIYTVEGKFTTKHHAQCWCGWQSAEYLIVIQAEAVAAAHVHNHPTWQVTVA